MNIFGYFIDINYILIAAAAFFGLIFIFTLIALILSVKANRKMKKLLNYNKGNDILSVVTDYYEKCKSIEDNFFDINESIKELSKESEASIKKVGTIRYDAFDENNANLSFAAAILDEKDNGFVINGVYSRGNTATYLKSIKDGKSIHALSDEEMQAISIAKENYRIKTNRI